MILYDSWMDNLCKFLVMILRVIVDFLSWPNISFFHLFTSTSELHFERVHKLLSQP